MTAIDDRIADVYDAARAYVAARIDAEEAGRGTLAETIIRTDRAWHNLRIACGAGCECDPGTCPDQDVEVEAAPAPPDEGHPVRRASTTPEMKPVEGAATSTTPARTS